MTYKDSTNISPTSQIVEEIRRGKMVILIDDEARENEGDLVMAAEFIDSSAINFMAMHGRGLICVTLTKEKCSSLNLPLMVSGSNLSTPFTLSIEAASGVTTGISASDRATTIRSAIKKSAKPQDLIQPGHVFPLMAQDGGVLARAGHTEAGCDLARLAGLSPFSVICEIMKDDGSMARISDLMVFSEKHDLKIGTIADLIQFRSEKESLVEQIFSRKVETIWGHFTLRVYRDKIDKQPHLVFFKGENFQNLNCPVRVHEPLTALDLLIERPSQHSWSLDSAMRYIEEQDVGIVVLLNCSKPPNIFFDHLSSLENFDKITSNKPMSTLRNYGIGAGILRDMGVKKMKLLGKPRKMPSMAGYSLEITDYISPK